MSYYSIQMSSGELYHHGILGMKWGKRNGPPYPLGTEDHSASEKKAGWKASLSSTTTKLANSNANRVVSKYNAKQAYKSGKIDKSEYKNRVKEADKKNREETKEALGLNKSRLQRASDINRRDSDALRKAGYAEEADALQKLADKQQEKVDKKAAKEKLKQQLKDVDPEVAKNKQTRRVAYDYHNLSDIAFKAKYQTTKNAFARRYEKSEGDTYGMGKKKAMTLTAMAQLAPPMPYYNMTTHRMETMDFGKRAAKALSFDIAYSEAVTAIGYNKAEEKYKKNH